MAGHAAGGAVHRGSVENTRRCDRGTGGCSKDEVRELFAGAPGQVGGDRVGDEGSRRDALYTDWRPCSEAGGSSGPRRGR